MAKETYSELDARDCLIETNMTGPEYNEFKLFVESIFFIPPDYAQEILNSKYPGFKIKILNHWGDTEFTNPQGQVVFSITNMDRKRNNWVNTVA